MTQKINNKLKEGDQFKKIGDKWYLCRRSK